MFPQSAKINIRKVSDPREEVKIVSKPVERSLFPFVKQDKLIKRILELTRNGKINNNDVTRLKYLLSHALPSYRLNQRLLKILPSNPSLSYWISSYFNKYNKLPKKTVKLIIDHLSKEEIYHSVHADLLFAVINNVPDEYINSYVDFCYKSFFERHDKLPPPQPSYKVSLLAWMIKNNKITYKKLRDILVQENNWWVQKSCLNFIHIDQYGESSYQDLLNEMLKNPLSPDSARAAAMHIVEKNLKVTEKHINIHKSARPTLFIGKKIKKIGKDPSLINEVLAYILSNKNIPKCDWESLLGSDHDHAERLTFTIKHTFEADMNSCLLTLDSFCDLVFEGLYKVLEPNKDYGSYGGMLDCKVIKNKFPSVSSSFKELHNLRKESHAAHPRIKFSNLKTRRLKHSDLRKVKANLIKAFTELATEYPLKVS